MISSLHTLSKSEISRHRRPYGYYATTTGEQKAPDNDIDTINGDDSKTSHQITPEVNGAAATIVATNSSNITESIDITAIAADVNEILDELSQRINDGSTEIIENITSVLDEQ